jgi:ABC-2 type transport system permease protein
MTTLTQPAAQPSSESARRRVTQAKVVRSEWTKFRTQPSTAWSLLATVALIVGFGVLYSLVRVTRPPRSPAEVASFDPTAIGLAGVQLAQIAVGVLGVLLVTSEYATGMIRTSMVAVPRRLPVLWGKAIVVALTAPLLFVLRDLCNVSGQPVGSVQRAARHLAAPAGRGQGGARQRPVPDRRGVARVGPGRPAAQHRRGDRLAVRPPDRGRLPAGVGGRQGLEIPAHAGRRRRHQRAARPGLAPTLDRVRPVLPYTVILLGLAAWLLRRRDV